MDTYLGKTVSLDCGGIGQFQGVIDSVHLDGEQTITLKNAFQDGKPIKMASITIRADHIQDLSLLDPESIKARKSTDPVVSTVEVRKKQVWQPRIPNVSLVYYSFFGPAETRSRGEPANIEKDGKNLRWDADEGNCQRTSSQNGLSQERSRRAPMQ